MEIGYSSYMHIDHYDTLFVFITMCSGSHESLSDHKYCNDYNYTNRQSTGIHRISMNLSLSDSYKRVMMMAWESSILFSV